MPRFEVTVQFNGFEIRRIIAGQPTADEAITQFYTDAEAMLGSAMGQALRYSGHSVTATEVPREVKHGESL
jgi:hypothetical protein